MKDKTLKQSSWLQGWARGS